jgi:hypothetical protein
MDASPLLRRTAVNQKGVTSAWAKMEWRMSLMLTMAFLEFRLSGFRKCQ